MDKQFNKIQSNQLTTTGHKHIKMVEKGDLSVLSLFYCYLNLLFSPTTEHAMQGLTTLYKQLLSLLNLYGIWDLFLWNTNTFTSQLKAKSTTSGRVSAAHLLVLFDMWTSVHWENKQTCSKSWSVKSRQYLKSLVSQRRWPLPVKTVILCHIKNVFFGGVWVLYKYKYKIYTSIHINWKLLILSW